MESEESNISVVTDLFEKLLLSGARFKIKKRVPYGYKIFNSEIVKPYENFILLKMVDKNGKMLYHESVQYVDFLTGWYAIVLDGDI